ncbi:solute carrier organic anion transporter family member 74D [Prorops nasuta]|uniref:solute carrier organic anion transporter family member 74D n=1 Tax=Prorops nasuta TaxID=863751 RepID=UPI0034CD85D4
MSTNCGICGIYPQWLRNRATAKSFIAVYGLLGTVQAMAFIYIIVTLTTLEKRFKIPSRTTGLILSGNEISEILSLILIYYGGSGNRPRWIAVGVGLSAVSCLIFSLPHLLYGPGSDAMALTKEHLDQAFLNTSTVPADIILCPRNEVADRCNQNAMLDVSLLPRLLVFVSQFVLGIGTTLYYSLGQTYLDDNTKKKNTPMLLGLTFALRTIGPAMGFLMGYGCLSLYIDPSLHPVINKNDPRWLGAWWLGWIILGITMGMFAVLMALFPRDLPPTKISEARPKKFDGEIPLKLDFERNEKQGNTTVERSPSVIEEKYVPTLREFPIAMKRILTNWLLTCNNLSGVFYVLGASAYFTFIAKYLEVQYGTSAAGGIVIAGPVSLIGMVIGFLSSGYVISKFKPSPRPLLAWNVIVGLIFVLGQITYIFLGCEHAKMEGLNLEEMELNFTSSCNIACNCDNVKYSPVCHEPSMTTFYSACHAGCHTSISDKEYGNCTCLPYDTVEAIEKIDPEETLKFSLQGDQHLYISNSQPISHYYNKVKAGPCMPDCQVSYIYFAILSSVIQMLGCSGKIGNILVNYRSVEKRDKSLALGVTLMIVSLFALIPGPIIYGAIIDSTCLIWDNSCGTRGNCWFYHRDNFRFFVNISAVGFTLIGVLFDMAVCYLGKDVDLYGDLEDKRREFVKDDDSAGNKNCKEERKEANGNIQHRIENSNL